MGNPHGITDQSSIDIDKAAKWTIFLLVDLRVMFIITYVYVSVVNLISTTANSEASDDIYSTVLFNVTSQPEHTNVSVSFIDDAILWNCRDHSVTKHYYRGLYWMLISAFSGTILAFIFTKITIVCGSKHGCSYLWRIAIIEYLQHKIKLDINKTHVELVKECKKLVNKKDVLDEVDKNPNINQKSLKRYRFCRVVCLYYSIVVLVAGVVLAFLFYDLHPLACIHGQREQYYDYEKASESVKISFSNGILFTQKAVACILPVLALLFIINAYGFYSCSAHIIDIYTKHIEQQLRKYQDVTDGSVADSCGNCPSTDCCNNHCRHTLMLKDCCCYFIPDCK